MKNVTKIILLVLTLALLVAVPFAVSASENEPELDIEAANLSFVDSVSILYAVSGDNADLTKVKLLVWSEPKSSSDEYVKGTESYALDSERYESIDGVYCKVFDYDKLGAHQMTDDVYARAYIEVGGTAYYSELVKYSVVRYASNKLGYTGTATESDVLKDTLDSMLAYGAAAQIFSDYNTDRLATDRYYKVSVEGGVLADGTTDGLYKEGEQVTVKGESGDTTVSVGTNNIIADAATGSTSVGFHKCEPADAVKEGATPIICGNLNEYDEVVYCSLCDGELSRTTVSERIDHDCDDANVCKNCNKKISNELEFYGMGSESCSVYGIGRCTDTDIIIPSVAPDGRRVTGIYFYAFKNCTNIKSVTIPDSVTSISSEAFYNCTSLESITIPDSVSRISDSLFYNCSSLKSVTIPEDVASIPEYTFYGCTALEEVIIPEDSKILRFEAYSFSGCSSLKSIYVPSTTIAINRYAFEDCSSLEKVSFSKNGKLDTIWEYAFKNCSALSEINFADADKLETIESNAFDGCSSIKSITFPDSLKTIYHNAFQYCTSLTDVTLGMSLETIRSGAFYNCSSLTTINFAEGGALDYFVGAFEYCGAITKITLPDSMETLCDGAFANCYNLSEVTFGRNITTIGDAAFAGCAIEEIVLPASVNAIGASAFSQCTKLRSVQFEAIENLRGIGSNAFYNCTALESIDLSGATRLKAINPGTFYKCSALSSIVIPESVQTIGDNAFAYCSGIKSLSFGGSVHLIGSDAFFGVIADTFNYTGSIEDWCNIALDEYTSMPYGTDSTILFNGNPVTELIIPSTIGSIRPNAFSFFSDLVSVSIPESVTVIESRAFEYCRSLERITIPASVTSIGARAFQYCSALKCIEINNSGLKSIEDYAFYECKGLKELRINDVAAWCGTSFNGTYANPLELSQAFYVNGSPLTSLIIPEGVTEIKSKTFYGCRSLASVTIPASVTAINSSAFENCSKLIEVINLSALQLSCGGYDNGYVAAYASEIHSGETKIKTVGDYLFYTANGVVYLIGYAGNGTDLLLPESYLGESYEIYKNAFYNRSDLTSVTFSNGVTAIGNNAFTLCTGLKSVVISNSVKRIGTYAFSGCSSLECITLPFVGETVDETTNTHLGYLFGAYMGSYNSNFVPASLRTVIVTGDRDIGEYAFSNCWNLTSIIVLGNVKKICANSFSNCFNLQSITLPNSLTMITDNAFGGCYELKDVYYTGSEAEWNSINRGYSNYELDDAKKHYNYTPAN